MRLVGALLRARRRRRAEWAERTLSALPQYTLTSGLISAIGSPPAVRQHLAATAAAIAAGRLEGQSDDCHPPRVPQCVICLEEYQVGEAVRVLPCGHIFHDACIARWLQSTASKVHECPVCKAPCSAADARKKSEAAASEHARQSARGVLFPVL
ncbi:hypothetical protein H4R19_004990 [Coemansia spiralis]|nr:hypothetical protein H4R19_004990 [Coemansia spiralis]